MTDSPAEQLVAGLPDIFKLTVVGMAIEPPRIIRGQVHPKFAAALDTLVSLGVAVATVEGRHVAYRLTALGIEIAGLLKHMAPSDGTVVANDEDGLDDGPEAA